MVLRGSGQQLSKLVCFLLLALLVKNGQAMPEPGKWTLHFNATQEYQGVVKNVYPDTKIYIKIQCHSNSDSEVAIGFLIRETQCFNEYSFLDPRSAAFSTYYNKPTIFPQIEGLNLTTPRYVQPPTRQYPCNNEPIYLHPVNGEQSLRRKREVENDDGDEPDDDEEEMVSSSTMEPFDDYFLNGPEIRHENGPKTDSPNYILHYSGDYLLVLHFELAGHGNFNATVDIRMEGPRGYLSLVDWPLLPFYGCMCAAYIIMGFVWLILCSLHWRDLLRIQYWIGAVIFLGMLEKAMFVAEYGNLNNDGTVTKGMILAAEVVSCAKRTLARLLVIIVSLGFGIVKPRLGQTMHKVLAIGGLYFTIACIEAYFRTMGPQNDFSNMQLIVGIPLAVIDSSICWWVFSALVQTTRTLRLRRNVVKLSLYRHFTNTLVFSVIASVVFMLWSIKYHRMDECLIDWRDLWVDEAFWHLLFSVILCVIMFLWRPSQNNQRYAFTPLLDAEDDALTSDDDADLETEPFFKDKLVNRMKGPKPKPKEDEDPMKWIEENIPESENPLPVLDSEEEIETTKFEFSKMQ